MNLNNTKEEVLQFKWTLNKILKNKNEAVTAQNWEAAAGFRDEERIIRGYLQILKNEITEELKNMKQMLSESSDDFALLEELLLLVETDADC